MSNSIIVTQEVEITRPAVARCISVERRDWKRIHDMIKRLGNGNQFWQNFFWASFPLSVSFFVTMATLPDNDPDRNSFFTLGWCGIVASIMAGVFWRISKNQSTVSKEEVLNEMKGVEDSVADREGTPVFSILSASYGTLEHSIDVTEILKTRISDDCLKVLVTNEIAGDPHRGVVKNLKDRYSHLGTVQDIEVQEGQELTIP